MAKKQIFLVGFFLFFLALGLPASVKAQTSPPDWRASLDCPPELQKFAGIFYCTGFDQTNGVVHVLVVDLSVKKIAVEYILPEGYARGSTKLAECQDPNVPNWAGPKYGCETAAGSGIFPTLRLDETLARAQDIRSSPDLAAVINADYAAIDQTHGPEGLLVVRGNRLDGAANCDTDYNAALRPWLGIGKDADPETGLIPAQINRLERDNSPVPEWMWTGVGGGPWLIRDGAIVAGAADCGPEIALTNLEKVENCTGNPKSTPELAVEGYNGSPSSGSCRNGPHTAAGLSQDGRWLFLVITTSQANPHTISQFMLNNLKVSNALKFDGGGSTHLLYLADPNLPLRQDPDGTDRPLSSYLGVYAPKGTGIDLPLDSEAIEPVLSAVKPEKEPAAFTIVMKNNGNLTWHPQDQVFLVEKSWYGLSSQSSVFNLPGKIAPGETASWPITIEGSGLKIKRFQMAQNHQPFGQEVAVIFVGVPEKMQAKADQWQAELDQLVQDWKAQGEEKLDELLDAVVDWAKDQFKAWWQAALDWLLAKVIGDAPKSHRKLVAGGW